RADVVGLSEPVGQSPDIEDFVSSLNGNTAVTDIGGRRVRGVKNAERQLARCSRELAAPVRIDDLPCVNRRDHVAVTAGSRNVEEAVAFHEERTLLGKEN